jgi:hypothetical protein
MTTMSCSWREFEAAAPALAGTVRERFGRYRHHVLGTVRADGTPRLSGSEVPVLLGELWLGSMPGARKARDLTRDPRCSLFANPGEGTDLDGGDVRVTGLATEVTDAELKARFVAAINLPEPFQLFRVEVTEVVRMALAGPEMVLTTWRPDGRGTRVLRRRADDPEIRLDEAGARAASS